MSSLAIRATVKTQVFLFFGLLGDCRFIGYAPLALPLGLLDVWNVDGLFHLPGRFLHNGRVFPFPHMKIPRFLPGGDY